ncbi:MAG: hypothetical protein L6V93_01770 [Clostridiales bacterium]|nr:MAG: hypothetical protein L6V93_01770 [Clostridiales bacterium]
MARVNHKLVKQRLNEKRSSITDRQFFSSRILAGHFEDIATAQTKRYKCNRRVRVNLYWNSKDGSIACTNNEFIRINCGNKFVTKTKGRENRYNIVAGLFAHELGHVLYTDFLGEQTHTNAFAGHYWYPATPILKSSSDKMNERAIWDYIAADEKNLEMVQFIVRHIQNIIEDGYIENRMLANFPGTLKYGLECVRKKHFESMDTVTQMIEYEDNGDAHICESILQIILSYAKFGEIKYGDEPLTDERIKIVFSLLSDIDRALLGTSSKERFDVTNTILIRCWDYIHSYLEYCKEKQAEAEAAGGTATIAETLGEMLKAISASSEIAEGETSPVQSSGNESNASATGKNRAKTRLKLQEAEKSDDENSNDGSAEGEKSDGEENSDENDSSRTETEKFRKSNLSLEKTARQVKYQMETLMATAECMTDISKMLHLPKKVVFLTNRQTAFRILLVVRLKKMTNMNRKYTQTQQVILNRSLRKWLNELLVRNSKANERKSLTRQRRTFHTAMFIPAYMFG